MTKTKWWGWLLPSGRFDVHRYRNGAEDIEMHDKRLTSPSATIKGPVEAETRIDAAKMMFPKEYEEDLKFKKMVYSHKRTRPPSRG